MTRTAAITLHQPFASLLMLPGAKDHETRSFPLPKHYIGQRMAIHAGARPVKMAEISPGLERLCIGLFGPAWAHILPRGAILGTVIFDKAFQMTAQALREPWSASDRLAGHWEPGRWAWRRTDPQRFAAPLPCKGAQGFWFADLGGEEFNGQ